MDLTSIAEDREFLALLDAHGYAAHDAKVCGGDFGSADRYAAAEEAVVTYLDGVLELRTVAAANVVNNALALQHERITRMESALQEIKRAAQAQFAPTATILAIADLADAGLRVT